MTERAGTAVEPATPLPDVILYRRDGCHLCDDARAVLDALLAERAQAGLPVPNVVERDVATNEAWQQEFGTAIPVVEFGEKRLELATSAGRLRRLLDS